MHYQFAPTYFNYELCPFQEKKSALINDNTKPKLTANQLSKIASESRRFFSQFACSANHVRIRHKIMDLHTIHGDESKVSNLQANIAIHSFNHSSESYRDSDLLKNISQFGKIIRQMNYDTLISTSLLFPTRYGDFQFASFCGFFACIILAAEYSKSSSKHSRSFSQIRKDEDEFLQIIQSQIYSPSDFIHFDHLLDEIRLFTSDDYPELLSYPIIEALFHAFPFSTIRSLYETLSHQIHFIPSLNLPTFPNNQIPREGWSHAPNEKMIRPQRSPQKYISPMDLEDIYISTQKNIPTLIPVGEPTEYTFTNNVDFSPRTLFRLIAQQQPEEAAAVAEHLLNNPSILEEKISKQKAKKSSDLSENSNQIPEKAQNNSGSDTNSPKKNDRKQKNDKKVKNDQKGKKSKVQNFFPNGKQRKSDPLFLKDLSEMEEHDIKQALLLHRSIALANASKIPNAIVETTKALKINGIFNDQAHKMRAAFWSMLSEIEARKDDIEMIRDEELKKVAQSILTSKTKNYI